MIHRGRRYALATRLLLAQTLVAGVAAVTVWLVAAAIGPSLFHSHLRRAGVHVAPATSRHVEEAFRSASAISVGIALLASLAVAIAVSAYIARRIADPVVRLAGAARDIEAGRSQVRVTAPALSSEFAELTGAFNAMAQRLENVETTRRRLLADLAHETRTPVATLDAYLEAMQDGVVQTDEKTIGMLREQTARLARLAHDITAVSEAEEHRLALHPRDVDIDDVISAAVRAGADRSAAKRVTLSSRVEPALPRVRLDPERIGQVLGNLLDNALRHTPPGGEVTIAAASTPARDAITITVADTGTGIPAEHLPHVFERFYRVDRARDRAHGGSGIGLAITRALVEAHGGTIAAASAGLDRGARFTITLPTR